MGFFSRLKNKIQTRKEYKSMFYPFFGDINEKLLELNYIDSYIPLEVTQVYNKIKKQKNKNYAKAITDYKSFNERINEHNDFVKILDLAVNEFDKNYILNNANTYDFIKLEQYYNLALNLTNYRYLNDKQLSFKNDVFLLYENYDLIKEQKSIFDELTLIYNQVNNNDDYLDHEFVEPLDL
jgi:hypothetical protein